MSGLQAAPKKHYADTILAICVAAFLLFILIICAAGSDTGVLAGTVTKAELTISMICFALFVLSAFAAAYLEMRYLGWQEIHLLPAAALFLGIASVLLNIKAGWFFIIYGGILGTVYLVQWIRVRSAEREAAGSAEAEITEPSEKVEMFGSAVNDEEGGTEPVNAAMAGKGMDDRNVTAGSEMKAGTEGGAEAGIRGGAETGTGSSTGGGAETGTEGGAETGDEAGIKGGVEGRTEPGTGSNRIIAPSVQNENFMESDAPDPEARTWKEFFEDGLVLACMISGTEYYAMDMNEGIMYHYNKLLKKLEKCGTGESPELKDEVKSGHKVKVQDFVTTAIEGEMGARVWNREKNKYCQSLIRLESTDRYPGIRLISVVDVSEAVEDLRDDKRELKRVIADYQHQLRVFEDDEKRVFFAINELMSSLVDAKSEESHAHMQSVCRFTEAILRESQRLYPDMGIDDSFIADVSNAAILHDIGKILIPDSILQNKGVLSEEEFGIMRKHPEYGAEIINRMPYVRNEEETMRMAHEIALHHHERADGSGYPHGIKAAETPFYVQAVAVSDAYDGLTAKRSYKRSCSHEEAYRMIMNGECGLFSDKVLACFSEAQESFIEIRIAIQ